jgi:hypothetical protein
MGYGQSGELWPASDHLCYARKADHSVGSPGPRFATFKMTVVE